MKGKGYSLKKLSQMYHEQKSKKETQIVPKRYVLTLEMFAVDKAENTYTMAKFTDTERIKTILRGVVDLRDYVKTQNITLDGDIAKIEILWYKMPWPDVKTPKAFFQEYFGEYANDTWGSGDVFLNKDYFIDLEFISLK